LRQTIFTESNYLAINDSCLCFDRFRDVPQFGKALIQTVSPA
jgi:hypothetical protein